MHIEEDVDVLSLLQLLPDVVELFEEEVDEVEDKTLQRDFDEMHDIEEEEQHELLVEVDKLDVELIMDELDDDDEDDTLNDVDEELVETEDEVEHENSQEVDLNDE